MSSPSGVCRSPKLNLVHLGLALKSSVGNNFNDFAESAEGFNFSESGRLFLTELTTSRNQCSYANGPKMVAPITAVGRALLYRSKSQCQVLR